VSDSAKYHLISLIGMMGVGKTTVGRMLARELNWHFHDNDAEIARTAGKPAARVINEDGEPYFRELEARTIEKVLRATEPTVISLGGGAVLREATRKQLAGSTYVVWLNAPVDALIERVIARYQDRPMIKDNPVESMRALYAERTPYYAEPADLRVNAARPPMQVVRSIITAISHEEGNTTAAQPKVPR
jgi:shikimate kinase